MIWLHGNDDAFRGMNGIEMNDKLDKLEVNSENGITAVSMKSIGKSSATSLLYKEIPLACSVWRN